jgi:hypothetical protein
MNEDNNSDHRRLLEYGARHFDEKVGLIGRHFKHPGYHTQVASGEWAHPVLDNFIYAALLLPEPDELSRRQCVSILEKLLSLQDGNPVSPTYGIWPWLAGEPIERMSPPDWNWADFCGGRIAEILTHADLIHEESLRARLRKSLLHAATSIFRRNVQPAYSNVAIMGAGVCAATGELLQQDWLLEYGRERLKSCVEHVGYHTGFTEYNSPAYIPVVIKECERILHLVRDHAVREHTEWLRTTAWYTIADHYHTGTSQWAGPHARCYHDRIDPALSEFLAVRTGVAPVRALTDDSDINLPALESGHPLPCPAEFIPAFQNGVKEPETRKRLLKRESDDSLSVRSTLWMTPDACLGSVNRGIFWAQVHPLIAYWRTEEDPAVVLKIRLLKDGREFASGLVRNSQADNRILTAVNLATDLGDWHPTLDRPASGEFPMKDLRLRYEILGEGTQVRQLERDVFALSAGGMVVRLCIPPCRFGAFEVDWQTGGTDHHYWVDAICYSGPEIRLRPEELPGIEVGAGLELLQNGAAGCELKPQWKESETGDHRLSWSELFVNISGRAEKHQR